MKHKIVIHVRNGDGDGTTVCRAADRWLPGWLIRLLFGNYRQVYLLDPGQTVDSVDVRELEGEEKKVKNDEG